MAAMASFRGLPARGARTGVGQASRTALSPQAQTAPHYEAGCSCVPLTIKAMVYSTCLNGVLIIRGRTQAPQQVS